MEQATKQYLEAGVEPTPIKARYLRRRPLDMCVLLCDSVPVMLSTFTEGHRGGAAIDDIRRYSESLLMSLPVDLAQLHLDTVSVQHVASYIARSVQVCVSEIVRCSKNGFQIAFHSDLLSFSLLHHQADAKKFSNTRCTREGCCADQHDLSVLCSIGFQEKTCSWTAPCESATQLLLCSFRVTLHSLQQSVVYRHKYRRTVDRYPTERHAAAALMQCD